MAGIEAVDWSSLFVFRCDVAHDAHLFFALLVPDDMRTPNEGLPVA